jgi:hypothetical protein
MMSVIYAEHHYTECVMLSVIMLSVIMLSVIVLNVVAPKSHQTTKLDDRSRV